MRARANQGVRQCARGFRPKTARVLAILLLALGLCGCETVAKHYITSYLPDIPGKPPGDKHCDNGHGNDCPTDTTKGEGE
jgi:hypothetical protein